MSLSPDGKALILLEAGRLLTGQLELPELLRSILELAAKVVDAERASLLLLDEATGELYFDVALGLGPEAAQVRLGMGTGIAGEAARDRRGQIINDVRVHPGWSPKVDQVSGFTTRSLMAAPLLRHDRVLGVVEAINKIDGLFDKEDLKTLEALAGQAAVAIENARLFSSLREERAKLDAMFAQMQEGAVLTDAKGTILIANPAAQGLLSLRGGEQRLDEAFAGARLTPPFESVLAMDKTASVEALRESPKLLILAGTATRLMVETGGGRGEGVPGIFWVLRDVTEDRSRDALKRTFLSLISHKLKTPLASITGYSEVLLMGLPANAPAVEVKALKAILGQGRKLTSLVNKLLSYTYLENPDTPQRREPCLVDDLVHEALKEQSDWIAERGAHVKYEPSGLSLLGDPTQLTEAIRNLIENAVKFGPKGAHEVTVSARAEGATVAVAIADRGPGIPPEDRDRIFSRFHQVEADFTGQVEGWGLGLAYVKKVVERHRGEVRLDSVLGRGTTVTLIFPRSEAAA